MDAAIIELMDETYDILLAVQRGADEHAGHQLRYALGHVADARRIVKRLVLESAEPELSKQEVWDAFIAHVNTRPRQWGDPDEIDKMEADRLLERANRREPYPTAREINAREEEVAHGDDPPR